MLSGAKLIGETVNKKLHEKSEVHLHSDCFKTLQEIIESHNFPFEKFEVITPDGFIIGIHRIPNPGGQPILLRNGFQGDSGIFLFGGEDHSLGNRLNL